MFPARFDKLDENNQVLDETEIFFNLNNNHNLTETDNDISDIKSPLEHQIQQQEIKDSGWRFQKINSMIIYFCKTGEMNGSNYIKNRSRSNAILNIENVDKNCFLWSKLAYLHPCKSNHPNTVSNYKQHFNKLNIEGFDFTNGFKCNDVHKVEKTNNLSIRIFELNFHQDHNKWRHELIPIEVSKNDSDCVIDLLIYKNHYALIKKLNVSLGDHHKIFICRRCLNSYTSENMLKIHKPKCENIDITTIRTSSESHIYWKKQFQKNPFYFRIIAVFEADNAIVGSSVGIKTTNIYKQNPILIGYYIISGLEDVLESGYHESPLGYNNVDWFVNEVIKLEIKSAFYFKKN